MVQSKASGLWLRYAALHPGTIQGKEGIKCCHLATLAAAASTPIKLRVQKGAEMKLSRKPFQSFSSSLSSLFFQSVRLTVSTSQWAK